MQDFPWYTSRERAFSFSQGALATMGVRMGAGAGTKTRVEARASRIALKILCKSSLEYLGTLIAATKASATGDFVFEGPAGWSDNLSPDLRGGEESEGVTEKATEGVTEGRF